MGFVHDEHAGASSLFPWEHPSPCVPLGIVGTIFHPTNVWLTQGRGQAGIFLGIAALSRCQGEPQGPLQGSTWQAGSVFILSVATPGSAQPPLGGRAGARCPGCQMELEPAALGLISHRPPAGLQRLPLPGTQMFASRPLLFPDRFWGRGLRKSFGTWFGASQALPGSFQLLSILAHHLALSAARTPREWGWAPRAALW